MTLAILGVIAGVLAVIPLILKYFPAKTPEEKLAEDLAKSHSASEEFKKTGRPE